MWRSRLIDAPAAVLLLSAFTVAQSPDFRNADAVINDAITKKYTPGAVLVVGSQGNIVHRKAYGNRAIEPKAEPMTAETVFDIASLTKLFTASAVMDLVARGKVRLNDPVWRYLPEFQQNGKQDVTIRMLLTHHSGLAPDLDLTEKWGGKEEAFRRCMGSEPIAPPGARHIYSDINFEVLGFLVEKVSGESLPQAIERVVTKPLHMTNTRFLPPTSLAPNIAPTARDENGVLLRGVVHDPTARRMGGVAGHAGLFSTADDLAKFAQAVLDRHGFLNALLIAKMTTAQQPPWSTALRGLGWDIDSPFANVRGDLMPVPSFGHTGYTGTSLWIDPTTRTFIILLANSVHPADASDAWGRIAIRGKVANAVMAALAPTLKANGGPITSYTERTAGAATEVAEDHRVLTGIDVLESNAFKELQGKRIALLTNQTGLDRRGIRTVDVLAHAPGVRVVKLFSVEHGIGGNKDDDKINEVLDPATKLPIVSVYGLSAAQRQPTAEQLRDIDALVIDLQDVGARFYTYAASMAEFMTGSAKSKVEIVVLDRPNPLNGIAVQGPMTDAEKLWPNFPIPIPLRHGMTMGELAKMYNAEAKVGAKITVVLMQGWRRADWFDSTGLAWVDPSPNLRSLNAAMLYPGVAQLEGLGSNVSVGRGTDTPFELMGAPYISFENATALAAYLNEREIPGVRFVARMFMPNGYLFAEQQCGGVNIFVTDREHLDSTLLGAELISALVKFYPNDFKPEANRKLVGNAKVLEELKNGRDPRAVAIEWQDALKAFKAMREKYLLYK